MQPLDSSVHSFLTVVVCKYEGLFVHLVIKFFAEFIHSTENFCNFGRIAQIAGCF